MVELAHKRLGLLIIVDENQNLLGVFSNGDLSRLLEDPTHDPSVDWPRPVSDWMCKDPVTVAHDSMALAAKELMQENSVLTLVVIDSDNCVCGAVQLYDILRSNI